MRHARRLSNAGIVDLLATGFGLVFVLGMVSPTLEHSRELVQRAKCTSNLKQLGVACETYLSDYRDRFFAYCGIEQFKWASGRGWMDKLFPYLCPDFVGKGPTYPESANHKSTEVYRCLAIPYDPEGSKHLSGYILNMRIYSETTEVGRARMSELTNRHKLIVLYDRNSSSGHPDDADMTDDWGNTGGEDGYGQGGLWYSRATGFGYPGPHDGGHNILFADWHVKWFGEWDSETMTRHCEY